MDQQECNAAVRLGEQLCPPTPTMHQAIITEQQQSQETSPRISRWNKRHAPIIERNPKQSSSSNPITVNGFLVQSPMSMAGTIGSQEEFYSEPNRSIKRGRSPSTISNRPHKRQNSQGNISKGPLFGKAPQECEFTSPWFGNPDSYKGYSDSLPYSGAGREGYVRSSSAQPRYGSHISVNHSVSHPQSYYSDSEHAPSSRRRHDEQLTFTRAHSVTPEAFRNYQVSEIYDAETYSQERYELGISQPVDLIPRMAERPSQPHLVQGSTVKIAGRYPTTCGSIQEPHQLNIDRTGNPYRYFNATPHAERIATRELVRVHRGRGAAEQPILIDSTEIGAPHYSLLEDQSKPIFRSSHSSPYSASPRSQNSQAGKSPYQSASVENQLRLHQTTRQPNSRVPRGSHYDVTQILPARAISFISQPELEIPHPEGNEDRFQSSLPEATNISYHPESPSLGGPLPRSVPMRERITPIEKVVTRAPRKWNIVSKEQIRVGKKLSNEKRPQDPIPAENLRQIRAAQLIISKEQEATAAEIFGEGAEEAQKAKLEKLKKERAEEKRRRQTTEAERLQKEEARELKEQVKARFFEQEAEQAKLEKQAQEARNKLRRERERKKREAAEAIATEEHRRKAEERIQAERQKLAVEAEERRKERQKATEPQVKAEDVARFRDKKEEIKKQVASLHVGNDVHGSGGRRSLSDGDSNASAKGVACSDMWEDTLFILRSPSPNQNDPDSATFERSPGPKRPLLTLPALKDTYDVDGRGIRGTPRAPTTAAELWAVAQSKGSTGDYRKERDVLDAERLEKGLEVARARLVARRAGQQLPPPPQLSTRASESVVPERKASLRSKKEQEPCKAPQAMFKSNTEPEYLTSPTTSRASRDLHNTDCNGAPNAVYHHIRLQSPIFSNDDASISYQKKLLVPVRPKAPSPKPASPPKIYKSRVTLVYNTDRQKADNNQRQRDQEKDLQRLIRTEKQKAERRRKEAEKARDKKRQQLLEEAKSNNIELPEGVLNAEVDAFMDKRERDIQRRAENRARKEKIYDFAPDKLLLESYAEAPDGEDLENQRADGDASIDKQQFIDKEVAAKESLRSLAIGRSGGFSQASAKRIADDSESDESEEDPDDTLPEEPTNDRSASDDNNDNSQDNDAIESSEPSLPINPNIGSSPQALSNQYSPAIHGNQADSVIRLYTAMEVVTKNGVLSEPIMKQTFSDMEEATLYTRGLAERYRARNPLSFSERFGEDRLYQSDISYDKDGTNSVMLYVAASLKSTADLLAFDHSGIGRRLPEITWLITRKLEFRADGEEGNSSKILAKKKIISQFSDLVLANNELFTKCFEFIRPTRPSIDHVEQHENSWGPLLRSERDKSNLAKLPLELDLEPDADELQWMEYSRIKFKVKEYKMNGPIN